MFGSRSTSKGLGLYIVRAIVEAHGGTIDVDCDDEQTAFLVTLPLHAKPRPEERR